MKTILADFRSAQSGATAIEYGLMTAILAITIIASFPSVADGLWDWSQWVSDVIATGTPSDLG